VGDTRTGGVPFEDRRYRAVLSMSPRTVLPLIALM
jgi:hypothetical protein